MIAHLRGELFEKNLGFCILEINNIGYEVFVPQRSIEKFSLGEKIFLYIFHRIKEDQNNLFGFISKEEKEIFEQLISVSGVGPKTALLVLEFSPHFIRKAIEEEDIKFLTQIKGMGKKTVSRLILELKGKLPNLEEKILETPQSTLQKNCFLALEGLGFEKKNIQDLFTKNCNLIENFSEEELLKWGLKKLSSF